MVQGTVCDDMSVVSEERENDKQFIDDAEYDKSVENHRAFDNVSRDYNDAINDSLSGFDFSQEVTIIILIMKLKKRQQMILKIRKKKLMSLKKLW